ncbi:TerB family tellurite resistance protein [Burkholderia pyrrocinia]|uniref:TerB family tellurite resistance protein n=1 Tax=Burkholderia pyrrocinia TaxID=60550 RepID=UPI0030CD5F98
MRSYPQNSPQAAARIVALILSADGHVDQREEQALGAIDLYRQLGLDAGQFAQVLKNLHEDHQTSHFHPASQVDAATVDMLTREIDSPTLRRKVLQLCFAAVVADGFLADGEIETIRLILNAWASTRA